mmetsp:Transcript_27578/g.58905  ORF Transcript_27578/g.58905 Transcript_27578/m.58905 type:complete len:757 (+) Transcript_27578:83-2353(+)
MLRRLPISLPSSLRRRSRSSGIGTCVRSRIIPGRISISPTHQHQQLRRFSRPAQATSIDIARFALLSIVSLPFTIWSACFTYDYLYRVKICQDALRRQDEDVLGGDNSGEFLGRDKELAEVSSLLDQKPTQIIVIAGGNEAGKSRFVRELLKGTQHDTNRGVTLVQLAQLVDSVSSFTHVFVRAFDLRWLQLRHALVDVLPFAGSEIFVMKERFSDRDLAMALVVITDALKQYAEESGPDTPRPVIVIDGIGEGPQRWMDSGEGKLLAQRLLQWSIYITKERHLCHIVLTGSEQLVLSLTDQNRVTRGHVRVVGLADLDLEDAAKIVRSELKDATDDEIKRITNRFGGFIHDVKGTSRDIQYRIARQGKKAAEVGSKKRAAVFDEVLKIRFQQQVEFVVAAFAVARENTDSRGKGASPVGKVMNPYLDPLKSIYSEAEASSQAIKGDESDDRASWTQLQLWQTLKRIVDSPDMAVSFSELRDNVFDGDQTPVLGLMADDVLSFEVVDRSSDGGWFWKVTPASPALGLAFAQIVKDGCLKETFQQIEEAEKRTTEKNNLEFERARLIRERENLSLRKKSLLQTIELGKEIGQEDVARQRLAIAFREIVREEEMQDIDDRLLRDRLSLLTACNGENDSNAKETDGKILTHPVTRREDHLPLQNLLKSVVFDIVSAEEDSSGEQLLRMKKAFNVLDHTKDGKISAEDVVRVVRASTGHNVSLSAAKQLVGEWDLNDDKSLDYSEFMQLLLSDDRNGRKD